MPSLLAAVLIANGLLSAATNVPTAIAVRVSMQGTAGLHIEGTTQELAISENDGELVFRVPLAGVDTGIGLRNRHMRGYLDTAHFPDAELHVPRSAAVVPQPGQTTESDTPGTLILHGVSRPCSVHYRLGPEGSGEHRVHATTRIDMRDFGIEVPAYLGVHVDPAVAIQVDFTLHDP
jgi:polyisoprenoid-binding protein YceI